MFEASHRLMAGTVPKRTLQDLQKLVLSRSDNYPWREVVDAVVASDAGQDDLISRGLRAQRDWILRGGREMPGPRVQMRAKALAARLVAQALFLSIWTAFVLLLLILAKARFPEADIYVVSTWLREVLPGVFVAR